MKKLIISLLLVSNIAHANTTAYIQYLGSIAIGGAINTILRDYENSRKPRTNDIQETSTQNMEKCEYKSIKVDNNRTVIRNICY